MSLKIETQVKVDTDPCVLAWDNKLFVGGEDGSIKSYDENLSPQASWPAHAVQLFALAAGDGKVYSASNDGGVRVWSDQGEKVTELPHSGGDIGAIYVFGKYIFTGDEVGNIIVYENNTVKAMYNMLEEVKDLQFSPPYLFTVRDLYVTVTEIKPDESKNRFALCHTMEGRAPLRTAGKYLLVVDRSGNNLRLHDASMDMQFQQLHDIKISDMIVTSLAVSGNYVWTGGWDGYVRRWEISNDRLLAAGEIELGACVNALVAGSDSVYAAVAGGKVVRIKGV